MKRFNYKFIVVLSLALGMVLPAKAATTGVCTTGTLPSSSSVDYLGQANIDIPIEIPPGVAGMKPKLNFHYNSFGSNGHLGMGWTISGLSAITRCGANYEQDGYAEGVHILDIDRLMLDGKRLVNVVGNYMANGTTYRTNPDEFSLITSHELTGFESPYGPAFFRVYTKDGLVMEYGATMDSRIRAYGYPTINGKDVIRTWAVNKIYDRSGNCIIFTYQQNPSVGEYWITSISYSGFGNITKNAAGLPLTHSLTKAPLEVIGFDYDTISPTFENGRVQTAHTQLSQLLRKVRIIDDNTQFMSYELDYENSQYTGRLRLKSIKKCDSAGNCLPSMDFIWSDPASTTLNPPPVPQSNSWGTGFGNYKKVKEAPLSATWKGNFFNAASGTYNLVQSGGASLTPYVAGSVSPTSTHAVIGVGVGPINIGIDISRIKLLESRPGDFNGDGRTDILQQNSSQELVVWLSDGTKFLPSQVWGTGAGQIQNTVLGDFDGNGKLDVCRFATGTGKAYMYFSTGTTFNAPYGGTLLTGVDKIFGGYNIQVADVNGDGRDDLVKLEEKSTWYGSSQKKRTAHVFLSTGTDFEDKGEWTPQGDLGPLEGIHFGDYDGDGKADIFTCSKNSRKLSVWRSNGSQFTRVTTMEIHPLFSGKDQPFIQLGDFNGDKMTDFILFQPKTPFFFGLIGEYKQKATVYISTGRLVEDGIAFEKYSNFTMDETNILMYPGQNVAPVFTWRLVDVNGDGKTDIWRHSFDPSQLYQKVEVMYSDGHKFSDPIFWAGNFGLPDEVIIADFDGDGRSDALRLVGVYDTPANPNSPTQVYTSNSAPFPDKLIAMRNGLAVQTNFSYKSICFDEIYGPDPFDPQLTGYNAYTREVRGPWHVVSELSALRPNDQVNHQTFQYEGAKSDVSHGLLGFKRISIRDEERKTTQRNTYLQEFPFTGLVTSTEEFVDTQNGPTLVKQTDHSYTTHPQPGGVSVFAFYETEMGFQLDGQITTISVVSNSDFDAYDNVTKSTHSMGYLNIEETTSTFYNDAPSWNLALKETENYQSKITGKPVSEKHDILFDYQSLLARRLVKTKTLTWLTGFNLRSLVTDYTYDAYANREFETVSGNDITTRTTKTLYDNRGRFPEKNYNGENHLTETTYEGQFGNLTTSIDPNSQATNHFYDTFGRRIQTVNPDGTTIDYDYCYVPTQVMPSGYRFSVEVKKTGTPTRRIHFDDQERIIREEMEGFNGTPIFKDYEYNLAKDLVTTVGEYYQGSAQSTGGITTIQYDAAHRKMSIVRPTGAQESIAYKSYIPLLSSAISPDYLLSWGTEETIPGLKKKITVYDDAGRIIQVQEYYAGTTSLLRSQTYRYGPTGKLLQTADAFGNVTTVTRDELGYRTALNDPDLGASTYQNNVLGQSVQDTDAKFNQHFRTYDKIGRLVQRVDPEGMNKWIYDQNWVGKLAKITGPNNYVEDHIYDSLGRLKTKNQSIMVPQGPGTMSFPLNFTYDTQSRVKTITYPTVSGSPATKVRYDYNARGYLEKVVNDVNNNNFWVLDDVYAWGEPKAFHYGDGAITTTLPDYPTKRIKGITSNFPAQAPFQNTSYLYDSMGRLQQKTDSSTGVPTTSTVYSYDDVGQLLVESKCNVSTGVCDNVQYSYDLIGNITSVSNLGTYTYASPKPHAVTKVNGSSFGTIVYDASGNMTSGVNRTLEWDSTDYVRKITQNGTSLTFYRSPDHEKIVAEDLATNQGTCYVGDFTEFGFLKNQSGQTVIASKRDFVYAAGMPVAAVTASLLLNGTWITTGANYLHRDEQGSVTNVTAGFSPPSIQYSAFGAITTGNLGPGSQGFTGQEHLSQGGVTGLIDMDARLYDPVLRRFLSADKSIGDLYKPSNFNRYSYVNNAPADFTDPTGFLAEGELPDWSTPIAPIDVEPGPSSFPGIMLSEVIITPQPVEVVAERGFWSTFFSHTEEGKESRTFWKHVFVGITIAAIIVTAVVAAPVALAVAVAVETTATYALAATATTDMVITGDIKGNIIDVIPGGAAENLIVANLRWATKLKHVHGLWGALPKLGGKGVDIATTEAMDTPNYPP